MVVFVLSGLWHGANWTFVIWGALNGVYLVTSILSTTLRASLVTLSGLDRLPILHSMVKRLVTFHLILLSWMFFRAGTVTEAVAALHAVVTNRPGQIISFESLGGRTIVVMSIAALVVCELLQSRLEIRAFLANRRWTVRWPAYVAFMLMLLLLGDFAAQQQFIYFQF
jgi:D-alanyl-lipoteichoic acid acyltransferase DltB (MBOAT superfamily)